MGVISTLSPFPAVPVTVNLIVLAVLSTVAAGLTAILLPLTAAEITVFAADTASLITMVVTSPSVTLNHTPSVSSLEMPPMLEVEMVPSESM